MRAKLSNPEYHRFTNALDAILKADPNAVKDAMEAEKRNRELEVMRTGKRGRGRPPKPSASSRVPSDKS